MKYFIATTSIIVSIGFIIWGVFVIHPQIAFGQKQLDTKNVQEMSISGRQILSWLNQLNGITLNTALFEDSRYISLQDFTVDIGIQDVGRPNPFLPSTAILRTQAVNVPTLNLPRSR